LQPHPEGVLLPVRAQPGAKSSGVRGVQDGALKVSVTQIAEKGKANKALLAVLSQALDVRKSQLELVAGATAGHKQFLVRGVTVEELRQRIGTLLE
jgi:hypothetical protein